MKRSLLRAVPAALLIGAIAAPIAFAAKAVLPYASFVTEQIPIGTDLAGRDWFFGGMSALLAQGESGKEYWSVTDRGPNDDSDRTVPSSSAGLYCAAKPSGKVIFLPDFTPQLVKLKVDAGELEVKDR